MVQLVGFTYKGVGEANLANLANLRYNYQKLFIKLPHLFNVKVEKLNYQKKS